MCKTPKSHCKNLELPPVSNLVFAPYVFIELPVGSSKFWQWDLGILHTQELCQKISEVYDQYLLCCLHFSICSLCVYWAPSRELREGVPGGSSISEQWYWGALHIQELWQKISKVYDQYLFFSLHFSICSLCIYWAPSRELQEGTLFLGNGILAPHIFRSYHIKFQKPTSNVCFAS